MVSNFIDGWMVSGFVICLTNRLLMGGRKIWYHSQSVDRVNSRESAVNLMNESDMMKGWYFIRLWHESGVIIIV